MPKMIAPKRKRGSNVDNANVSNIVKVGPKTKNKTTGPKKTKKLLKIELEQLQLNNSDENMLGALKKLESPKKKQKKRKTNKNLASAKNLKPDKSKKNDSVSKNKNKIKKKNDENSNSNLVKKCTSDSNTSGDDSSKSYVTMSRKPKLKLEVNTEEVNNQIGTSEHSFNTLNTEVYSPTNARITPRHNMIGTPLGPRTFGFIPQMNIGGTNISPIPSPTSIDMYQTFSGIPPVIVSPSAAMLSPNNFSMMMMMHQQPQPQLQQQQEMQQQQQKQHFKDNININNMDNINSNINSSSNNNNDNTNIAAATGANNIAASSGADNKTAAGGTTTPRGGNNSNVNQNNSQSISNYLNNLSGNGIHQLGYPNMFNVGNYATGNPMSPTHFMAINSPLGGGTYFPSFSGTSFNGMNNIMKNPNMNFNIQQSQNQQGDQSNINQSPKEEHLSSINIQSSDMPTPRTANGAYHMDKLMQAPIVETPKNNKKKHVTKNSKVANSNVILKQDINSVNKKTSNNNNKSNNDDAAPPGKIKKCHPKLPHISEERQNRQYTMLRKRSSCHFCSEIGQNCGLVAGKCPNRPCNICKGRHRHGRCRMKRLQGKKEAALAASSIVSTAATAIVK